MTKVSSETGTDEDKEFNDFWEYDPLTNEWTQRVDFGGGIWIDAISFSVENKGYISNGNVKSSINQTYVDMWEYISVTEK